MMYVVYRTKVCPKCSGRGWVQRDLKWWQKILGWTDKPACDNGCGWDGTSFQAKIAEYVSLEEALKDIGYGLPPN